MKDWKDMNRKEKVDYLWELHQTWDKKLEEVADMEEVWEEEILLFGRFSIGKKIKRKKWLPRRS